MHTIRIMAFAATFGTVVATTGSVLAGPFTYDSYSVVNNQNVHIIGPDINEWGGSGQIVLHGSGASQGVDLLTWCIDIFDWLLNSGSYNIARPGLPLSAATIGEIGALMDYGNAHIADSFDVSSGTQIAIWTVLYGGQGYSFIGSDLANSFATSLLSKSLAPDSSWLALTSAADINQSLATAAPEPASLLLLGFGLAGLGLLRWKRQREPAGA